MNARLQIARLTVLARRLGTEPDLVDFGQFDFATETLPENMASLRRLLRPTMGDLAENHQI